MAYYAPYRVVRRQPQTETKMADEAKKTVLRQTGIKVKLVGEDGNAFNGKFFVMESFSS